MTEQASIPYGRQSVGDGDIDAIVDVLHSDWLTCGPRIEAFEQALASYCGAKHAIAVTSGTAALHVAMLAAGSGSGDRLLTSANTFLASANVAEFVGAIADFADIDRRTRCVSRDTLEAAWCDDVRVVIPVDFAGYPCVDEALGTWIREQGALVIEDASHAIGASRDGFPVGGLPWVDMTTFSFHPVKTITTGEGGAVLTNNDDLADRCRLMRNHGMQRSPELSESHGPWYYEMHAPGFNYRITDIQCALGIAQLQQLDAFVKRRQEIVDAYNAAFAALQHVHIPPAPGSDAVCPAWHLYVLECDFVRAGTDRGSVMKALRDGGISTQVHYIPVHLQPYYRARYGYAEGKCPEAEAYYAGALSLPLFPAMTDADVQRVIDGVCGILS